MILRLIRQHSTIDGTLGRLFINGAFKLWTLEPDEDRPQHPAIPCGTYTVVVTPSIRFKRMLPLVIGVKGRSGIRFHPGNAAAETDGCILLGLSHVDNVLQNSRAACELFQAAIAPCLAVDEVVTLTIVEGPT